MPLEVLGLVGDEPWSGRVFRAYDHLIVAGIGWLIVVPIARVEGSLQHVIDLCPVPYADVLAVVDPHEGAPLMCLPAKLAMLLAQLSKWWAASRLDGDDEVLPAEGWSLDAIGLSAQTVRPNVARAVHASGLRLAVLLEAA